LEVMESLKSPNLDIVEKKVARPDYVGLEVYVQDQESVSNESIDGVIKSIESSLEGISSKTVEDFKSRQRINSCICWSVILILVTNYFWPWFSLFDTLPSE
jgi:hypothetical protein